MKLAITTAVLVACSFAGEVLGAKYSQTDSYVGSQFLQGFSFQNFADPTHGRVNYVDESTAKSRGLVSSTSKTFTLRADHTTKLSASGPGRDSFRIMSNKQYRTHVAVFDINHMPQGCGTWPAVWETGDNWPSNGEVDIVEGVNDQAPNRVTLHTGAGCTMPSSGRSQTGTVITTDCNAADNGNTGCSVGLNTANNYGPAFNKNGGGWYAVERTNNFINVWFWQRNDKSVPSDVLNGASTVNTDNWGKPAANFPKTQCNIASKFGPNNIIINLALCGDWAGNAGVYRSSGCPSTCVDYVNNNPSAFSNAYFEFASLKVYQ